MVRMGRGLEWPALHLGDSSLPPYPGWCKTCSNFDLRGSWADAGDFGIYTVNHAISAWTLLNLNELFPDAFVDGELSEFGSWHHHIFVTLLTA